MADGWASPDLSGARLLAVWERATGAPPYQQALAILAAAYPDEPPEALVRLGIGERDSRLLSVREQVFGPALTAVTVCPSCGERLELEIAVEDIRADFNPDPTEPHTMQADGWELTFRLPTSRDLAALDGLPLDADPRAALLERCVLAARQDGEAHPPADLPPEVQAALAECMEQADPQADVQLNLTCPACATQWQAAYDVVTYLWAEIETRAETLLREVHVLASVYGWSEGEILAMSARRRQRYLEMIAE
jgi:hypothetical protein